MHLLVLSAFRPGPIDLHAASLEVSMHLLVLSAFRPSSRARRVREERGLNAPFGAQCFPTG